MKIIAIFISHAYIYNWNDITVVGYIPRIKWNQP